MNFRVKLLELFQGQKRKLENAVSDPSAKSQKFEPPSEDMEVGD